MRITKRGDIDSREWLDEVVREAASALGRGVVGNLVVRKADGSLASVRVASHGIDGRWRDTLHRTAERMPADELARRFATSVALDRGVLRVSACAGDRRAVLLDALLDDGGADEAVLDEWRAVAGELERALRSGLARASSGATLPDDPEAAWRALMEGRLALVDRFDRDGRRFVVVRAAAPDEREALSARERRVLASVALGHQNRRIAVELGVSESTVSATLRGAARKLGVRSRVELARILGPCAVTSRS